MGVRGNLHVGKHRSGRMGSSDDETLWADIERLSSTLKKADRPTALSHALSMKKPDVTVHTSQARQAPKAPAQKETHTDKTVRTAMKSPAPEPITIPKPAAKPDPATAPDLTSDNLYEVLGITRNDTMAKVKKVYRVLARKYHPDKRQNKHDDTAFKVIKEAHEILSNESRRRFYDQTGFKSEEDMMASRTSPPGSQPGSPGAGAHDMRWGGMPAPWQGMMGPAAHGHMFTPPHSPRGSPSPHDTWAWMGGSAPASPNPPSPRSPRYHSGGQQTPRGNQRHMRCHNPSVNIERHPDHAWSPASSPVEPQFSHSGPPALFGRCSEQMGGMGGMGSGMHPMGGMDMGMGMSMGMGMGGHMDRGMGGHMGRF